MNSLIILQSSGGNPAMFNTIFLLLVLAIMYFFFMRPQMKRHKEQTNFVKAIKKGDEVVTGSGFIGKINRIDGHVVQLEFGQKNFVNVLPSAISKEMTESYLKAKGESK